MRIVVIGSGYVGLVAGACFAELGHEVVLVDNDKQKLSALRNGGVPIHEAFLPELLDKHRGRRLTFSNDLCSAVASSSVVFIAVGTPASENGSADLSYVESVARAIGASIAQYTVVVEKSTVPVYTSAWIRKVILLNGTPRDRFDVVSNPEFLREGTAVRDFLYPDRIVVGANNERSAEVVRKVYAPLLNGSYYSSARHIPGPSTCTLPPPLIQTSAESAELIKHASNAFLAMKISFVNAVANICEAVAADVEQVCLGVGSDSRIGHRFLRAGVGYGGSCFPKDVAAFHAFAQESGYDCRLLKEVMSINDQQRQRFLRKVRNALWTLKGKRLGILGLAFKGGTDDIRESPAIAIAKALLDEGAHLVVHDPAAMERAREVLGQSCVSYAVNPYDAATDTDALLVLTDWEQFASLDLRRIRSALKSPIIIDGRNLFDPKIMAEQGFFYYSVGRPHTAPEQVEYPTKVPKSAA
jgi:UDPglucose 6-dehydrogenase